MLPLQINSMCRIFLETYDKSIALAGLQEISIEQKLDIEGPWGRLSLYGQTYLACAPELQPLNVVSYCKNIAIARTEKDSGLKNVTLHTACYAEKFYKTPIRFEASTG